MIFIEGPSPRKGDGLGRLGPHPGRNNQMDNLNYVPPTSTVSRAFAAAILDYSLQSSYGTAKRLSEIVRDGASTMEEVRAAQKQHRYQSMYPKGYIPTVCEVGVPRERRRDVHSCSRFPTAPRIYNRCRACTTHKPCSIRARSGMPGLGRSG